MKFIERLLPHRYPFLMVGSIVEYRGGSTPTLKAEYSPRPSHPVFSATEPPLHWPSAYVIEGLGQCCSLLSHIRGWEQSHAANASIEEHVRTVLTNTANTTRSYTLEQLLETFEDSIMTAASRISMLASVDIEIADQVREGELLRYSVEQTRVLEGLSRFTVQAFIETQIVARGTIVGARVEGIL